MQPAQGFCDGPESACRRTRLGEFAVVGAETSSCSGLGEGKRIHAEGGEEWCDMVAAAPGSSCS